MALTINNPVGGATLSTHHNSTTSSTTAQLNHPLLRHHFLPSTLSLSSRTLTHIVAATGKFTPRTGKFDSRNRRGSPSITTTTKEEDRVGQLKKKTNFEEDNASVEEVFADDGFVMPQLPGTEENFWEGEKWEAFGFFAQYMWAFGVIFALVACGVAVSTYNDGATDFRETPAYKESVQSPVLEGPDASDSDVFESNPTEEAPALE